MPWALRRNTPARTCAPLTANCPGATTHFNPIAEHLQTTLVELKVDKALIDRTLAVVQATRADVLNRSKLAN